MKKALFALAIFAMATLGAKAQDSVFSYAYQGNTLYYIIDSVGNAIVVPPLWPDYDEPNDATWTGYTEPSGAVVVPDSVPFGGTMHTVTEVGHDAFYHCELVTSITLPASVTTFGEYAFGKCYSLTSFTVPEGATELSSRCFWNDTLLASVTLPSTLEQINYRAFYNCKSLQSISLPDGLTIIDRYAFYGCSNLLSVDIPGSVSVIDEWCFSLCRNLASVTLHEGTETIGYGAFKECTSLTTINYPSTLKVIDDFSFQYDSLLAIPLVFTESLIYLGRLAYGDCYSIVTASLPGSLGEVPGELFYGCRSLSTVTLGDGICFIGEQAFNHCPNIDTIFVKSAYPPDMGSLSDSTFFTYNSTVVVPCGTRNAYIVYLGWSEFAEIIEDCGDGIDEHDAPDINIYATDGRIIVEGADGETVSIFDINGRSVHNSNLPNGVYFVIVGNRPAKKVVMIR
ncbi:MAG: leucine-rich repeat domain-containing protein [Bacteroidales bacterium]|nr:leucine-rich repeat domain-containing protein [Bacteroidales bacterium]